MGNNQTDSENRDSVQNIASDVANRLVQLVPLDMLLTTFIPMLKVSITVTEKTDRIRRHQVGLSSWCDYRLDSHENGF